MNVEATARLADWCERHERRTLFTSTDLVFDGSKSWNREDDPAEPSLAYGQSKLEAEPYVRAIPDGLVVRLSLLYGPSRSPGRLTYMDRTVSAWKRGEPQTFFEDEFRTPLDLATAARAIVGLVESTTTGLIHLGGRERLSRYELARRVALALGFDPRSVAANRQGDVPSVEPRPADVSLDTERFASLFPDFSRDLVRLIPTVEEATRPRCGEPQARVLANRCWTRRKGSWDGASEISCSELKFPNRLNSRNSMARMCKLKGTILTRLDGFWRG